MAIAIEGAGEGAELTAVPERPDETEQEDFAQTAVALLRSLPRPVHQAQLAGFLSVCRAHPLLSAAVDYTVRKQEQAERAEQRLERQFWLQVRERLTALHVGADDAESGADRRAGQLAQVFARHLVAENLLRIARTEDAGRAAPRRPTGGRAAAARTGGERG